MSANTLPAQIDTLRSALNKLKPEYLDGETRAALSALRGDLGRILNARAHDETVVERLEELALRFEADHPTVGAAIREVMDTLVKAGM